MKHKGLILTLFSAAGTVVTSILAIRAYKKVKECGEDITPTEFVTAVAPPVLSCAATIGMIFANQAHNVKIQKSVATSYAALASSFGLYRKEVANRCGAEFEKDIYNTILNERLGVWDEREETDEEVLCFYEPKSDLYFHRTMRFVNLAAYHLNRNYALGGYVTMNDYYDFLQLPKTEEGENLCWDWELGNDYGYSWIDFHYVLKEFPNGDKYFVIHTPFDPHNYSVGDEVY